MKWLRPLWNFTWPPLVFWMVFLVCFLCFGPGLRAADPADLARAVVRLTSHGGSGTVIYSGQGRALILSCGHAFEGQNRSKPIVLDIPLPNASAPKKVNPKLIKLDYVHDLSLIEVQCELPYVVPVATAFPTGTFVSCGYDGMQWPAARYGASVLSASRDVTYTREHPRPGRSGGALIETGNGVLVGVVIGYEVDAPARGMYVSHNAILEFLQMQRLAPRGGRPYVTESREPLEIIGAPPCNSRNCPGGVCPPGWNQGRQ